MKSVVEKYLEVVLGKQLPADERLPALLNVLNELQLAASQLKDTKFSDCDGDPPADLSREFHARVACNFPELGNYSLASPIEPANQTVMIGDAINDAADIASDLSNAIWRWKHTSEADALWHLELDYRTHWGRHLNDLRWYVYELMIA